MTPELAHMKALKVARAWQQVLNGYGVRIHNVDLDRLASPLADVLYEVAEDSRNKALTEARFFAQSKMDRHLEDWYHNARPEGSEGTS